jgi:hypothetical protein
VVDERSHGGHSLAPSHLHGRPRGAAGQHGRPCASVRLLGGQPENGACSVLHSRTASNATHAQLPVRLLHHGEPLDVSATVRWCVSTAPLRVTPVLDTYPPRQEPEAHECAAQTPGLERCSPEAGPAFGLPRITGAPSGAETCRAWHVG